MPMFPVESRRLPALVVSVPVLAFTLMSPVPAFATVFAARLTLLPCSAIAPPAVPRFALTARTPLPLLSWSAIRVSVPAPFVVTAAFTAIALLACRVNDTPLLPVAVPRSKALATVMLLEACNTTLAPADTLAKLPPALTLSVEAEAPSSANR